MLSNVNKSTIYQTQSGSDLFVNRNFILDVRIQFFNIYLLTIRNSLSNNYSCCTLLPLAEFFLLQNQR